MYNSKIISILESMLADIGDNVLDEALTLPIDQLNKNHISALSLKKRLLLASYQHFVEWTFPILENGAQWINAPHHPLMINTLQKVIDGRIARLILNVPPRFSKTILTTTLLNAYGMVKNPYLTKNMTISFNQSVLNDEGKRVKELCESYQFRRVFDIELSTDTISKTDFQLRTGAATKLITTFGQITGNSCGAIFPETYDKWGDIKPPPFAGFLSIDDSLKPADARTAKRELVNDLWPNTLVSRLATPYTPTIIIMQRIHDNDLSGYMLEGHSNMKWHHLLIQGETKFPMTSERYAKLLPKSTHGIPICYGNTPADGYEFYIPLGPTWSMRKGADELKSMSESDMYNYSAQYDQLPGVAGGAVFKEEWIKYYTELPDDIKWSRIYGDTAHKTKEWNDYSVFQLWAYSPTMGIFLIDQIRDKWEAPELQKEFERFYKKHKKTRKTWNGSWRLQCAKIEDKASGIGLIQTASRNAEMTIIPIQRSSDKYTRAMGVSPEVQAGKVHIPLNAPFTKELVQEITLFSANDTHAFDDQVDPMMDAVEDCLINGKTRDWSKVNYDNVDPFEHANEQISPF